MKHILGSALCVLLFAATCIEAHSWVACTDYRGSKDYYDQSKCFGFPRNWVGSGGASSTFGVDTGFNYQAPRTGDRTCRDPLSGSLPDYTYTGSFPMAKYAPGSTVCLAWPSKNHVAATCTNQYIPDTSLKLFVSGARASGNNADPNQSQFSLVKDFTEHQNGVIDFKGFQNCPKFCENMDKSLCGQCFTVPSNLQVGKVYTFQWYWVFNAGDLPYTTCWEAMIVSGSGGSGGSTTGVRATTGAAGGSTTGRVSSTTGRVSSTTGSVTPVCPGIDNGGGGNSGNLPNFGDSVAVSSAPFSIPQSGTFQVAVAYAASGDRVITVDILDTKASPTWYGKGEAVVSAGKGTKTMTVTVQNSPPKGTNYVLRAWLVDRSKIDTPDPWTYELSRNDYAVSVGSKASYAAAASECDSTEACAELCGGADKVSTCECLETGHINVICTDTEAPVAAVSAGVWLQPGMLVALLAALVAFFRV